MIPGLWAWSSCILTCVDRLIFVAVNETESIKFKRKTANSISKIYCLKWTHLERCLRWLDDWLLRLPLTPPPIWSKSPLIVTRDDILLGLFIFLFLYLVYTKFVEWIKFALGLCDCGVLFGFTMTLGIRYWINSIFTSCFLSFFPSFF